MTTATHFHAWTPASALVCSTQKKGDEHESILNTCLQINSRTLRMAGCPCPRHPYPSVLVISDAVLSKSPKSNWPFFWQGLSCPFQEPSFRTQFSMAQNYSNPKSNLMELIHFNSKACDYKTTNFEKQANRRDLECTMKLDAPKLMKSTHPKSFYKQVQVVTKNLFRKQTHTHTHNEHLNKKQYEDLVELLGISISVLFCQPQ